MVTCDIRHSTMVFLEQGWALAATLCLKKDPRHYGL